MVQMPMEDQFWGDRAGAVTDPDGYTLVDRHAHRGCRAGRDGAASCRRRAGTPSDARRIPPDWRRTV